MSIQTYTCQIIPHPKRRAANTAVRSVLRTVPGDIIPFRIPVAHVLYSTAQVEAEHGTIFVICIDNRAVEISHATIRSMQYIFERVGMPTRFGRRPLLDCYLIWNFAPVTTAAAMRDVATGLTDLLVSHLRIVTTCFDLVSPAAVVQLLRTAYETRDEIIERCV